MIQININIIISYPISSSLTSKCCSSLLLKTTFRSSHSQMFLKIGVPKNFAIFKGKQMCWNNFIKRRLQLRLFPMNIAKFLRTAFFIEHLQWLFLNIFIIFLYFLLVMFTNSYRMTCFFFHVLFLGTNFFIIWQY